MIADELSPPATDAQAFWGPVERLYVVQGGAPSIVSRPAGLPQQDATPTPLPGLYTIDARQADAMARITDTVFRDRLSSYLRDVWREETGPFEGDALQSLIADAIGDCTRLGVCGEMDVVIMAIARLRIPDMVASDEFWQAVIEQRPNPNQRSGAFLGRMIVGFDDEQTIEFYQRLNGWWQFEK